MNKDTVDFMLVRWLLALLAAFVAVKGYRYWPTMNPHCSFLTSENSKNHSLDVKKYKGALNTMSSLKIKSDPPKIIKGKPRKKTRKNGKGSVCFSSKQARKLIDSSVALGKYSQ